MKIISACPFVNIFPWSVLTAQNKKILFAGEGECRPRRHSRKDLCNFRSASLLYVYTCKCLQLLSSQSIITCLFLFLSLSSLFIYIQTIFSHSHPIYLYISVSIHQSIDLTVYLYSIYLPMHSSIYLSIYRLTCFTSTNVYILSTSLF